MKRWETLTGAKKKGIESILHADGAPPVALSVEDQAIYGDMLAMTVGASTDPSDIETTEIHVIFHDRPGMEDAIRDKFKHAHFFGHPAKSNERERLPLYRLDQKPGRPVQGALLEVRLHGREAVDFVKERAAFLAQPEALWSSHR